MSQYIAAAKSGYFRQFWQHEGTIVQGAWIWDTIPAQTNYSSVRGEGAGIFDNSGGVDLDEYKWSSIYLAAGTYKLTFVTILSADRGIIEFLHGITSLGTYDTYSAGTTFNAVVTITFTLLAATTGDLRFRNNGKNTSSTGYYAEFSKMTLEKTG